MRKIEKILTKKIKFQNKTFDIFLRPDADESVVAEIFNWQEYRAAEDVIKKSRFPIVDIGAHIGIFSLYVKALNPVGEIYALEPEEENFALLKKNISGNDLEDIKIFRVAMTGESGERKLILEADSINHHLLDSDSEDEIEEKKCVKVQGISFRDFLRKNNISKISLLKMDIEGGEYEIFESMSADDFGKVQNAILEYHNYGGRSYKEVEKIFRQNGFSVQIFPSQFEKDLGFILARNKRKE